MSQPSWLNLDEALRYFGLGDDLDALEALVVEYDIDVQTDPDGNLVAVDCGPGPAVEALFERHRKIAGHRPDDPEAMVKAQAEADRQDQKEKQERDRRKSALVQRVANRGPA